MLPQLKVWWLAIRPKTLCASIVPVVVGTALAKQNFELLLFLVILLDALLLQIASNFANDVGDFEKGTDTAERLGPLRVTQAGLVEPQTMKRAVLGVLFVALLLGIYLVWRGGFPILLIGLASLVCAVIYTSGPFALAYYGLGELFVILFFGLFAVGGTYYLFTGTLTLTAVLAGLSVGMIATAILVVNNLRDVDEDARNGKRTLAVRFGKAFAKCEYVLLLVLSATVPLLILFVERTSPLVLLASLFLIPAIPVARKVCEESSGEVLNGALASTGKLLALYGLLFSSTYLI